MVLAAGKVLKLLVIDDSDDDVFFVIRTLQKSGLSFEHTHVTCREEMIGALPEQEWDLVITDHHMNGFSSTEAISIIRKSHADLPIVIVSGEIGEEVAISAMHDGAQDFVMKDNLSRLIPVILREYKQYESQKAHRKAEADYRFLRYHDKLTSLVNRQEFESRITKTLLDAKVSRSTHVMIFLDLDQFKLVK